MYTPDKSNLKGAYDAFNALGQFLFSPLLNRNEIYFQKHLNEFVKIKYVGKNRSTPTNVTLKEVLESDIFYVCDASMADVMFTDAVNKIYELFESVKVQYTFKEILATDGCYEIYGEHRKARYIKVQNGTPTFYCKAGAEFVETNYQSFIVYLHYKFVKIENF